MPFIRKMDEREANRRVFWELYAMTDNTLAEGIRVAVQLRNKGVPKKVIADWMPEVRKFIRS